jgi:type VI protein secretion system component Hcp
MATSSTNELLMQLVDMSGKFIPAECQTEVNTDYDDMVIEYVNGSFFQVDDFTFGMNVDDEDAASDAANTTGGRGSGAAGQNRAPGPQAPFAKWKSGTDSDAAATQYPLKVDEFSFTRRYDCASPVLFDKCGKSESLKYAYLVKRKVVGGIKLQSFLRFKFEQVLITHISWQDAEVMKETLRFVYRHLEIQYKRQLPDGSLGPVGSATLDPTVEMKGG